jgi:hypothetical protein
MKKLLTIIALLFCLKSFGQINYTESGIRKDFSAYYDLIADKKVEQALEYLNPKLFDLVPKEQMKNLMEAVYKMPNIEYKTGSPVFLKFDDPVKIDDINYVRFVVLSPIEMKFNDIESTEEKVLLMLKSFETKFGSGNVKFDKESGFYKINAEKVIIASSRNNFSEWKFVTVDNPRMKVLLEKFIPSELLK